MKTCGADIPSAERRTPSIFLGRDIRTTLPLIPIILVCLFASALYADQESIFAIVDVNVIPMDQERVLERQTVIVKSGRIAEIGSVNDIAVPETATRIEGTGKYLVPGFTDTHVHLTSTEELILYLANGVTTIFNLDGRPAHLKWRKWIETGKLIGPRIITTGPVFWSAHTPEEAVRLVDEQAEAGYDAIKIYNQVSREEYPALITEAKKRGLLLMGHIARGPNFEMTMQYGQSVAHMEEFTYTFFNPHHDDEFAHMEFDATRIPELVQRLSSAGVSVTATISTFRDILSQATEIEHYLRNPELNYLAPWLRDGLQKESNRYQNRYSEDDLKQLRLSFAFQRNLIRAMQDGGVPLLSGTDATTIGPVAGFAIHVELQELVNSGLSPFQALQTTTVNPAKYFRRSSEAGTIEPGKEAALVMLSANPLENISHTNRISGVLSHARWYDEASLKKMLDEIPSSYQKDVRIVKQKLAANPVEANTYLEDHDPLGFMGSVALAELIDERGFSDVHRLLQRVRKEAPSAAIASEETLNTLGYNLLFRKKYSEAIAVFQSNVEDFPESINLIDSLADGYAHSGDTAKAVEYYKKALERDPNYPNAEFARKFIAEHAAGEQ